jgi:hypothetical protein
MNSILRHIAVRVVPLFLAGCAVGGVAYNPAPLPRESDALVYIYRTDAAAFAARDAYFYIDDVNVVDLSRKGYTWFHIPAGEYTLKQKWPVDVTLGMQTLGAKVRWLAGRTYYYRLELKQQPFSVAWRFSQMPPGEATRELAECRLQPSFGLHQLMKQASSKCATCL